MCVFSKEETVNFKQFMRVLARFRPTKTNVNKNKLNTREEKLKCKCILDTWVVNAILLIIIIIISVLEPIFLYRGLDFLTGLP